MPLSQRLLGARSRCSGYQKPLRPCSVSRPLNTATCRRWVPSPREGGLLRAMPHVFFARLFLCFSHLLSFLLHPPLFFFSLLDILSCSEELSPPYLAISSSTDSLRNSWAWRKAAQSSSNRRAGWWQFLCLRKGSASGRPHGCHRHPRRSEPLPLGPPGRLVAALLRAGG